jgi:prepilin-type N-terminal cleavage/methylation domain-containing protein
MSLARVRAEREAGYTLSEVLIAVVILGIAVVAIVGSLGSSIFVSQAHRDIVTSDALVRRYAEQLTRATFAPCATTYAGLSGGVPAGYSVSITSIDHADGSVQPAAWGAADGAHCPANNEIQRITVQAQRTSKGTGVQKLTIIKRAP